MAVITPVLAPNPGPMTLTGTHSFLVHQAGQAVVVDPGPDDQGHLRALIETAEQMATTIVEIWTTHSHPDHVEGVARLAAQTGASVLDATQLADRAPLVVGGLHATLIRTPGHTLDSVSFLVDHTLLVGDHFMGTGTPVIAFPDGDLALFLDSLDRVQRLAESGEVALVLPAHGDPISDVVERCEHYRRHRHERLDQVRQAVSYGARTPDEVLAVVYPGVSAEVRPAARASVAAQLAYLDAQAVGKLEG